MSNNRLALTAMSNALRIDPYNEQYWAFYGQVYDIICCNSRVQILEWEIEIIKENYWMMLPYSNYSLTENRFYISDTKHQTNLEKKRKGDIQWSTIVQNGCFRFSWLSLLYNFFRPWENCKWDEMNRVHKIDAILQ